MEKHRVLFHLDEGSRGQVRLVFANVENLVADFGEGNVEVELVVNAEGVLALLKVPDLHGPHIERLRAKGVRICVCENSLRQMGLTKAALLDGVETVPAGVGELVRKQAEGWAYIRP
jgi:intracellular sulfur oxidation DsrE/DsrF family protein